MYQLHLEKNKTKQKKEKQKTKNKNKTKKDRFVILALIIIGLPARAIPNQEMRGNILCKVMKDKMAEGSPRRHWVSHSPIIRADYSGEGTGHFKSSGEQIWKSIRTNSDTNTAAQ